LITQYFYKCFLEGYNNYTDIGFTFIVSRFMNKPFCNELIYNGMTNYPKKRTIICRFVRRAALVPPVYCSLCNRLWFIRWCNDLYTFRAKVCHNILLYFYNMRHRFGFTR